MRGLFLQGLPLFFEDTTLHTHCTTPTPFFISRRCLTSSKSVCSRKAKTGSRLQRGPLHTKKKTVFATRRNCFRYSYSHELLRCCSAPPLPLSPLRDAGLTDEVAESNLNLHKAVLYVSTFYYFFFLNLNHGFLGAGELAARDALDSLSCRVPRHTGYCSCSHILKRDD